MPVPNIKLGIPDSGISGTPDFGDTILIFGLPFVLELASLVGTSIRVIFTMHKGTNKGTKKIVQGYTGIASGTVNN